MISPNLPTPEIHRNVLTCTPTADPRFARIYNDPTFRFPSKKKTHVAIDERFTRMLHDDDFSRKSTVDRYGRKLPEGSGREELAKLYNLEGVDDGDDGELERDYHHYPNEEARNPDDDDDLAVTGQRRLVGPTRRYDPARDGGFTSSEDDLSSDDEHDEADVAFVEDEHQFPDTQVEETTDVPMGEVSSRIAVVNLDWDNIRAVDLMAVFSSFCPSDGRIQRVAVYPSEFGKERMAREAIEGPPPEIFTNRDGAREADGSLNEEDDEEDDEDTDADEEKIKKSLLQEDQGEEFDNAKLRRYQLERLRYYYAILTLSSAEAAKTLYDATDGTEYLTTANFFDLRFVPDDVSFEEDRPRDECTRMPDHYKPNTFVTDALQHSKVKLTWDAEDNVRKEMVKKAFSGSRRDIEDNDLKAYLGSDSSDEEDDDEPSEIVKANKDTGVETKRSRKEMERERLRAALGLKETMASSNNSSKAQHLPVGDMQITFQPGLSEGANPGKSLQSESKADETTIGKYVRKEKERKQRRRDKVLASRAGNKIELGKLAGEQVRVAGDGNQNTEGGGGGDGGGDLEFDDDSKACGAEEELGFEDPFFTTAPEGDASISLKSSKSERRASRRQRREREVEGDDEVTLKRNRAELELVMLDDPAEEANDHDGEHSQHQLHHFDINEIAKAEKASQKNNKKKKEKKRSSAKDKGGQVDKPLQDGFKLNVQDPRFLALFHRPEYAIDPTNPRYRDTQAMRTLLDEGRKRRRRPPHDGGDDVANEDDEYAKSRGNGGKRVREAVTHAEDDDVNGHLLSHRSIDDLAKRVKKK